ncbi:hypothetical protein [Fredinandcohnia quinoae]|uniref:DUF4340 domain-containing protein n=1 Tax=Fredinandcohnia quinoae TaxID=2918902 RepID=A0AAW5E9J6_9BACI|nr:hypothetical protein [Fredinandcohnia sp. SECRCQ15]MCH1626706.1 hypothetical protein [Fredinandcohnia sp. SECRCQ15]
MNVKIFWAGILIVLIGWGGNFIYYESKQIEQPIFLDHYYEMHLNEEKVDITFYYLTNKKDTSSVNYVDINGVDAYPISDDFSFVWVDTNTPQFEQEFSHQYLKSITVSIPSDSIPLENSRDEVWTFGEMDVFFSDGKTIHADIGKVAISKRRNIPGVLESRIGSSSNQGVSEQSFVATEPITINDILFPFPEDLSQELFVKIDLDHEKLKKLEQLMDNPDIPKWYQDDLNKNRDDAPGISISDNILPLELEKDDWVRLLMYTDQTRSSYFYFTFKIIGTSKEDEPFLIEVPIIDHPYLNEEKIKEIIASKGGENN